MTARGTRGPAALVAVGLGLAAAGWSAAAFGPLSGGPAAPVGDTEQAEASAEAASGLASAMSGATWRDDDWAIFEQKVRWASEAGLDDAPIGEAMARIGRTFVGTPYAAHTLEAPGEEHVVVDLRGLDCVTFVENTFALARFVHSPGVAALSDRAAAERSYEAILADIRYRHGRLDGYASRLHYFTDWIADNAARGSVRDVTRALGGVRDPEPVDFMTTHADAYPQLADPANVARVREAEAGLTAAGRYYLPQDAIAGAASGIRDGDVIAATSTVPGLDVAHTGLAMWQGGTLRLLHAPLAGGVVQISEVPLAERVASIGGQDGIIVARPLEAR